jgi:hypothetical protein
VQRTGLGRCRHFDVKLLWSQEVFEKGIAEIKAVATTHNVADLGTKFLASQRIRDLLRLTGCSGIAELEVDMIESGEESTSIMKWATLVLALCAGAYFLKRQLARPATRTVATQSPVTYTELRGVLQPRFTPLGDRQHGAWPQAQ